MTAYPARPVRQPNSQALMHLLVDSGPLTRVELATESGLSKQTVSLVIRELEVDGWVRESGRVVGRVGRSPLRYEFNPRAAYVVGIDLGATRLRAMVTDLAGAVMAHDAVSLDRRGGSHVIDQVDRLTRELTERHGLAWHQVCYVAIGSPGTVDPVSGMIRRVSNIAELRDLNIREVLRSRFDVPVLVDNEVNMSVLGERWLGHGRSCEDFVALELGTGVGLGMVLGGQVYRGVGGAAGEVAFLPVGGDPFDAEAQLRGVYENACCGEALFKRYTRAGGRATTLPELFEAIAAGDPIATTALDEHARTVALGIAATTSVLDPELVVLGGGLGARPELLDPVRRWLDRLVATPPRVETSALGNRATLVGAVAAALTSAHQSLFGSPAKIPQPAIEHHRELMSMTADQAEVMS